MHERRCSHSHERSLPDHRPNIMRSIAGDAHTKPKKLKKVQKALKPHAKKQSSSARRQSEGVAFSTLVHKNPACPINTPSLINKKHAEVVRAPKNLFESSLEEKTKKHPLRRVMHPKASYQSSKGPRARPKHSFFTYSENHRKWRP